MSEIPDLPSDFLEMRLDSISVTNVGFIVFLKPDEGDRVLPIFIGANEAQSIALALGEEPPPRPMTHDLMKTVLEALDATVTRVEITDLREGTFYGKVRVLRNDIEETEFDARPSDAIALALRFEAPLFAARSVFEEAAVSVVARGSENAADDGGTPGEADPSDDEPAAPARALSPAEKLRAELDAAVAAERYEEAARLRDALRKLSAGN